VPGTSIDTADAAEQYKALKHDRSKLARESGGLLDIRLANAT